MKVCGFSFIRNAIKFDYSIIEAITSILPICDSFVVAVGNSDDATLELIKSIDSNKIIILETIWRDEIVENRYKLLAEETNKAFQHINETFDWTFYIQGDEAVHEDYLPTIKDAMIKYKNHKEVDGLLFKYLHFYGSYDYVGYASTWYDYEIRVIRNNKKIYSYHDAQGFRKDDNKKLNVIPIEAYIYHYGWVREPTAMKKKQNNFHALYNKNNSKINIETATEAFDYQTDGITELKRFKGTHPKVMQERISRLNWAFDVDLSMQKTKFKDMIKRFCLKYLGLNFYYTNYKIVKKKE